MQTFTLRSASAPLLAEYSGGYLALMIWAAVLPIFLLTFTGVSAWYVTSRQLAATTPDKQRRLARQVVAFSAAVGVGILIAGAVAFVLTGYRWPVLAVMWAYGLFHIGPLTRQVRRLRKHLR
jgi:hypothetical protein